MTYQQLEDKVRELIRQLAASERGRKAAVDALRPFAMAGSKDIMADRSRFSDDEQAPVLSFTLGDFRAAADALTAQPEAAQEPIKLRQTELDLAEAKDANARAFIAGAKWWEFNRPNGGATMWQSDQVRVYDEAVKQWPYIESGPLRLAQIALEQSEAARRAGIKFAQTICVMGAARRTLKTKPDYLENCWKLVHNKAIKLCEESPEQAALATQPKE